MKNMYLLLAGLFLSFNAAFAAESGTIVCNPDPIMDLTQPVTFTYEATETFAGEDILIVHFWLNLKDGTSVSGNASTNWDSPDFDIQEMEDDNADRIFTISVNFATALNLVAADFENITSIGILVRNATGSMQTDGFSFGYKVALGASDRFKISFGVDGQAWNDIQFVKATEEFKFTATVTLPDDYEAYKYWVGYNGGGIGDPGWTEGQSSTNLISSIPGIKAGENVLEIYSNSTEQNWGITANGATPVLTDRFKISYGVEGQSGWVDVDFTQDTGNENLFYATITFPSDYENISFYVGYNGGGSGTPAWVEGQSSTVLLNTIPGIKAGDNKLTIDKTSEAENWGITASSTSSIADNYTNNTACIVNGNELTVSCDDSAIVSVYAISGKLVNQFMVGKTAACMLETGMYIVNVNGKSFKVIAE